MLFNVVVSLLLLYVIVKLHLVKSLLDFIITIVSLPLLLFVEILTKLCSINIRKPKKKAKKSKKQSATDQQFYTELKQLLEKYDKTSV